MELVFQEKVTNFPDRMLWEERELEETVDLIIPDSYPDAVNVINAFGAPLIYSVEVGADSVSVSGEVQAGVLYEGEEGQIRSVKGRVPFTMRRELKAERGDARAQCRCELIAVDARILNSRKLLLRAGISCAVSVYGRKEYRFYDVEEPAPVLQLKRTQLPLRLPVGMGEKKFSLQEELPLPQGMPAAEHLLKTTYNVRVMENKPVGDKAVFKGELCIKVLYESEDESLHTQEWTLPFSQYAILDQNADDCELNTCLALSSADTQPDGQDPNRLLTSVELWAKCTAMGISPMSLVEDAYCTDGELVPEYETQKLTAVLDRQEFKETVSLQSDRRAKTVLCAHAYPTKVLRRREGETVCVEQGVGCDVLYYDPDGKLKGCSLRGQAEFRLPLEENARCSVAAAQCAEPFCTVSAEGIMVKVPVELCIECTAEHELKAVRAATVTAPEGTEKRPALILRFTEEAEALWDIAKSCKTSEQAIREANELSEDTVPANTLLLIPM